MTPTLRISPAIAVIDPLAAHWLDQAHARLRRELAWAWHERGAAGELPRFTDRAAAAVDAVRRWDDKQAFLRRDPAARYLSERIAAPEPIVKTPRRGGFAWVCEQLALAPVERFWLALVLAGATDAAVGSVMAACANDPDRARPTLALAQQLWDTPGELVTLADPAHPLHRTGLIIAGTTIDWRSPASVPPAVAAWLVEPGGSPPASIVGWAPCESAPARRQQVIAVQAPRGDAEPAAEAAARASGRRAVRVRDEVAGANREHLDAIATWAWLAGVDLILGRAFVVEGRAVLPRESIPITIYVDAGETARRPCAPDRLLGSPLRVPVPDHAERVTAWVTGLGKRACADATIAEHARRFRIGRSAIAEIARSLADAPGEATLDELGGATRRYIGHAAGDLGDLAEQIEPRFSPDDLVLPRQARRAFDEVLVAMRGLAEAHHGWGTAHAWRSAGVSVLFAGPSGTGKTMAAECLARALALPLYRVDVSQVVDKYVGETEKNLKRVFDAAESSDLVLFLDEAEAIFGRRMDARSAQDRWANLEISYLLTRMESARGLTILATNRRDDFDTAFLRRLRYVVEFPLPDADARLRIWRHCLPPNADATGLDLELLARRFVLTGGQIRSAVLNACLQSAGTGERRLGMEAVIVAVWRELQKHDGALSLGAFGPYAELIRDREVAS
jgi:hypothetical protein